MSFWKNFDQWTSLKGEKIADKMIECVMNVSEGRDASILAEIAVSLEEAGSRIIDQDSDPDHNRTVFSFVGTSAQQVQESAFCAIEASVRLLDIRVHEGVHPRLGVVDVVPFVPVGFGTLGLCIKAARSLAQMVGESLQVPVFLYGLAALRAEYRELPFIRRGGLEALAGELGGARSPDFGPQIIHPSAGVTIIGARGPLIAFNVVLDSPDLGLARQIASQIRERDGGLPQVRALGFSLASQKRVQVSVNLLDFEITPLSAVYEAISDAAARSGVAVRYSEIVGLIPERACLGVDADRMRLQDYGPDKILERRIENLYPV